MNRNLKFVGIGLIVFSALLLLVLAFVKMGYDKQSTFLCETFHENQLDMEQCPAHKSNVSWLLTTAFAIGFLMLGVGILMLFMPKESAELKREFKAIDESKLDEEEKKVYGLIKGKGGSAYQTDLIKETGLTKVRITRILDKLEMKGILERKRRGMTNIVVLK